MVQAARILDRLGFSIIATGGTCDFLKSKGVAAERVNKVYEGRPNIADAITNGEIQMVVNTPVRKLSKHDDSYIRKAAIRQKIPYVTTMAAALISAKGIAAYREGKSEVRALQEYHARLR